MTMKTIRFDRFDQTRFDERGEYLCSEPGDMSGDYVRAEEVNSFINDLRAELGIVGSCRLKAILVTVRDLMAERGFTEVRDVEEVRAMVEALQWIASEAPRGGLYHGGETYYALNQRIAERAKAALASLPAPPAKGGEG